MSWEAVNAAVSTARAEVAAAAPDAATAHEAIVQVYGARTVRWRGAFAIHPWIAVKRSGASEWTTYQMIGWRSWRGGVERRIPVAAACHVRARP